jgi:hypothetical protein
LSESVICVSWPADHLLAYDGRAATFLAAIWRVLRKNNQASAGRLGDSRIYKEKTLKPAARQERAEATDGIAEIGVTGFKFQEEFLESAGLLGSESWLIMTELRKKSQQLFFFGGGELSVLQGVFELFQALVHRGSLF